MNHVDEHYNDTADGTRECGVYKSVDEQFKELCEDIRENGYDKKDRTGVGSRSVFGRKMIFDIRQGRIPLLTTKKVGYRKAFEEIFWFISGTDWIDGLLAQGNHIWDSWVDPETARYDEQGKLTSGRVPNVYGVQWRHWLDTRVVSQQEWRKLMSQDLGYECIGILEGEKESVVIRRKIDQLTSVIRALRHDPDSRRIIMSAWNVGKLDQMGLPPCHKDIQFWTRELTLDERIHAVWGIDYRPESYQANHEFLDHHKAPRRAISAQVYLR